MVPQFSPNKHNYPLTQQNKLINPNIFFEQRNKISFQLSNYIKVKFTADGYLQVMLKHVFLHMYLML